MLPTFDGTCPLDWLFQADQYFTFYNIPVDQRVALASFHFQGDALSWYKYMHNNGLLGDWVTFTRALELRFGPSSFANHQAALFKLKQDGSVATYQTEFERLRHRCNPPQFLLLGHDEPIPLTSDTGALTNLEDYSGDIQPHQFLALSAAALHGTTCPLAIRITGQINGHTVTVLVDSGSSHDIIKPCLVSLLHFTFDSQPSFPVMIGNGTFLHCTGQCPNINLRLSDTSFSISPYVFPIEGADVVLGMSWLSALGPVKADFSVPQLTFNHLGKEVTLRGESSPKLGTSTDLADKVVVQQEGIDTNRLEFVDAKAGPSHEVNKYEKNCPKVFFSLYLLLLESYPLKGISSGAFIDDLTMPPRKDTSNDNAPTSFQDQLSALNAKVDALVNSMTNLLQPPAAAAAPPPPNNPLHKSPKIMLPTFDGTCPLDWLFQADQYFTFYNIPVDQRVALASFHFQGDALSWYKYMHNNGLLGHRCNPPQFLLLGHDEPIPLTSDTGALTNLEDYSGDIQPHQFLALSAAALHGTTCPLAIRITGQINGHTVTVLVDSGSSHDIIKPCLVSLLHFTFDSQPSFPVMIGNGTFLHCTGQCPNINLRLSDTSFSISPYVFPIEGADVVLGMSWLSALGPVKADFSVPQLTFNHLGKEVTLRGESSPKLGTSTDLADKVVVQQEGIDTNRLEFVDAKAGPSHEVNKLSKQSV
ncbi:retrotransposon gag protein [Tanacetum coccineum]